MKRNYILKIAILLFIILNNDAMANMGPPPIYYTKKPIYLVLKNSTKDYIFYYRIVKQSDTIARPVGGKSYVDIFILSPRYNPETNNLADSNSGKLITALQEKALPLINNNIILIQPKEEELSIYIYGQNVLTKQYTFPERLKFPNYVQYKEKDRFIIKVDSIYKQIITWNGSYKNDYYYRISSDFLKDTDYTQNNFHTFINHDDNGKFNIYGLMLFSIFGTIGLITLFIVRKRNSHKQVWA